MSLPRYAEYTDSGVEWLGQVPRHWEVRRLKVKLSLITERAERRSYPVALENVESWSGRFVATEGAFEGDGVAFASGDVLFGKLRPYLAKVYLAERAGEAVGDFHVLRPEQCMAGRFVQYQVLSQSFIDVIDGSTFGSKMPRVSWESLGGMPLTVPPRDEQVVIATFLDSETSKIDVLIADQEKLIALLAEKRQATISHAVTRGLSPDVPMKISGVQWLGEVPAHWEVAPLKRFWSVTDCKHITAEFVSDGYPLASIREVQSTWVLLEDAKRTTSHFYEQLIAGGRKPMAGDLIFSRNATVGEVAQVTAEHPPFAMGQDVCLLRKGSADFSSDFLQAVIRSGVVVEQLKNIMVGSTFLRVNVEEIRNLNVPMPPPAEQVAISTFINAEANKLGSLHADAERAIALLKERRRALIAATVTGQIDVRGAADA